MGCAAGVLDGVVVDEGDDPLGDGALVEGVPGGLDAGDAAPAGGGLFGAAHGLQHLGEVGVAENLADLRDAAVGVVDLAGRRVEVHVLGPAGREGVVQFLVDREAVLGEANGGLEHLGVAHGAEAGEGQGPGVDDGGDGHGQVAVAGDEVDAVVAAPVDGEGLGGPAHAADGVGLPVLRGVDEGGDLAADAAALGLEEVEADAHRRRRVDGVAPLLHDAEAGRGGQVVAGGDDAPGAHDDGPGGEFCHVGAPVWSRAMVTQSGGDGKLRGSHPHPNPLPEGEGVGQSPAPQRSPVEGEGAVTLTPALSRRGRGGRRRGGGMGTPHCPAPLDSGFRRNDGWDWSSTAMDAARPTRGVSGLGLWSRWVLPRGPARASAVRGLLVVGF